MVFVVGRMSGFLEGKEIVPGAAHLKVQFSTDREHGVPISSADSFLRFIRQRNWLLESIFALATPPREDCR